MAWIQPALLGDFRIRIRVFLYWIRLLKLKHGADPISIAERDSYPDSVVKNIGSGSWKLGFVSSFSGQSIISIWRWSNQYCRQRFGSGFWKILDFASKSSDPYPVFRARVKLIHGEDPTSIAERYSYPDPVIEIYWIRLRFFLDVRAGV